MEVSRRKEVGTMATTEYLTDCSQDRQLRQGPLPCGAIYTGSCCVDCTRPKWRGRCKLTGVIGNNAFIDFNDYRSIANFKRAWRSAVPLRRPSTE